jgi:hypothetical protein
MSLVFITIHDNKRWRDFRVAGAREFSTNEEHENHSSEAAVNKTSGEAVLFISPARKYRVCGQTQRRSRDIH